MHGPLLKERMQPEIKYTWCFNRTLIYIWLKPTTVKRHELINIYGAKYLDAGFKTKVSKMELEKGEYRVGLLIAERDSLKGFKLAQGLLTIYYN